MLDTAIIGGGLTGLALAMTLERQGLEYSVFEARHRLGGRVLSRRCPVSGLSMDLGPTWYWPATQPGMVELVAELGLTAFPQYDDGSIWVLTDPNEKPKRLENQTVHAGAMRVAGGTARLIDAMAGKLPAAQVFLSHALSDLRDRGTHVELLFNAPHGDVEVNARRVVLAMPPRLIEENILFAPALPDKVQRLLMARPTWMAQQAKAIVVYDNAANFRSLVGSGNALVHHEQAVLAEVSDASNMEGTVAALGGFLAMPPPARVQFRPGMEMLVTSQFTQLFGPAFETGRMHYQDWASEPFTCSSLDRRQHDAVADPHVGDTRLHARLWGGKVWFAGSEYASRQAGYLEGALIDATRVFERLIAVGKNV